MYICDLKINTKKTFQKIFPILEHLNSRIDKINNLHSQAWIQIFKAILIFFQENKQNDCQKTYWLSISLLKTNISCTWKPCLKNRWVKKSRVFYMAEQFTLAKLIRLGTKKKPSKSLIKIYSVIIPPYIKYTWIVNSLEFSLITF